jgi:hypothetical protein
MVKQANTWIAEAKVVVLAYRGSGAVPAVTAHDAGAKILILEGQPRGGRFIE